MLLVCCIGQLEMNSNVSRPSLPKQHASGTILCSLACTRAVDL